MLRLYNTLTQSSAMLLAMRLTAGILTYNDQKYLARCLETLVSQQGLGELSRDWRIVILDNGSKDIEYLLEAKRKYPLIDFLLEKENYGFGKSHNDIMRRFPAEFHAVLNNDVLCASTFLARIVEQLEKNSAYGSATGKLLRWHYGGNPEKTTIIDTVGIAATKNHRFFDLGQGEEDRGQYDAGQTRFGASGAAVIYRRSDLEKVRYGIDEFYDETMFMYKEDCDLAERLVAIGKPCLFVPEAVCWHDRTASGTIDRSKRSQRERAGSAAHHSLIIQKHWQWFSWTVRVSIFLREFFRWGFILLREPVIFIRARSILRSTAKEARRRRKETKHAVSFEEVRHLFL